MNDDTNGLAAGDTALFNATVTGSDLPAAQMPAIEAPNTEVAPTPLAPTSTEPPAATMPENPRTEPAIPPARLREEADARRAAERERDTFKARLERLEAQQRQPVQPEQRQRPEFWDNPDEWGRSLVTPIHEQLFQQRQGMSRLLAEEKHGADTVKAAYQALGEALQADPATQADYVRIMRSNHPYGELIAWHRNRQVLNEIGTDPAAYRSRIIDEALKDPQVLQRAIEAARGGAQPVVEAPTRSGVPSIPSLQGIGTAASPASAAGGQSDAELFSATTSRRR